jgi:hypothetical protein
MDGIDRQRRGEIGKQAVAQSLVGSAASAGNFTHVPPAAVRHDAYARQQYPGNLTLGRRGLMVS